MKGHYESGNSFELMVAGAESNHRHEDFQSRPCCLVVMYFNDLTCIMQVNRRLGA